MSELEIKLSYHLDPGSPHPYWVAQAGPGGGRTDWDAVGATPLDAMSALAEVLYRELRESRP